MERVSQGLEGWEGGQYLVNIIAGKEKIILLRPLAFLCLPSRQQRQRSANHLNEMGFSCCKSVEAGEGNGLLRTVERKAVF